MKLSNRLALLAALLGCLILATSVMAQESPHYGLSWNTLGVSGGTSSSSHYALNGTGGQGMPGLASSTHYRLGGGFWYGMPAAPGRQLYLPVVMKR